jgi:hypothetical protein
MDIKSLISSIAHVAETLAPAIVPGAAPLIKAGEAVVGLIDQAKATFGEHDVAVLQAHREELLAKVHAHADSTASRLEG